MAMLCFDIRSLEARAVQVSGVLQATDEAWGDTDTRPVEPGISVSGRLSSAGDGRFYFSGRIEGTAVTECRRCLANVAVPVAEDLHLLFADSGSDEADEDDVYQIPVAARELDLAPAVREEWLLAAPVYALCRSDCLGLCVVCGSDRNAGECSCAPASDPRWESLRAGREG